MDEDVAYVCLKAVDMPIPYIPSLKGKCRRCKQEVYYSKHVYENDAEARKIIDAGQLLCVECALEEKQIEIVVPDASRREFFKYVEEKESEN